MILLVSDIFLKNLVLKCIFSCLTVVPNFMQKACIAEILTKVTGGGLIFMFTLNVQYYQTIKIIYL